jgi:adenylate cyclase
MEELVQALFDIGVLVRNGAVKVARSLAQGQIPPTVQGILASRIDRLPSDEKELLQVLAVIGREFSLTLIRAVTGLPEDELERMLSHLRMGEFIYEQPAFPDVEYTFKHALTQEVAYNSLLVERRKLLHERTGDAIEALFAEKPDEHFNELARHYGRSQNLDKAVKYLQLAGQLAAQRSAYAEATVHLTNGLDRLRNLPEDPERARQELKFQLSLAQSLRWTKFGSPEAGHALIVARDLAGQVGTRAEVFAALQGLQWHHLIRLDLGPARELGEQLLATAEGVGDPAKLTGAHAALGAVLLLSGEFAAAREHYKQASARSDWRQSDLFDFIYPNFDPWALWALGYAEQALKSSSEALALAGALSRPALLANALHVAAILHMYLREPRMAQESAEALTALATEYGLSYELSYGNFTRGWALAQQGQLKEGIAQMRRVATAGEEVAARPRWFAQLAETCAKSESPGIGLRLLDEGLALIERSGERMYEAELRRVKGELLVMQDAEKAAEAEHSIRTAIEVARLQGGKSLELRATTSIAQLLAKQGRRDEARALLSEIYGWFTEGFHTADLKGAKALLEQLSA